jgi:hypothetical protein
VAGTTMRCPALLRWRFFFSFDPFRAGARGAVHTPRRSGRRQHKSAPVVRSLAPTSNTSGLLHSPACLPRELVLFLPIHPSPSGRGTAHERRHRSAFVLCTRSLLLDVFSSSGQPPAKSIPIRAIELFLLIASHLSSFAWQRRNWRSGLLCFERGYTVKISAKDRSSTYVLCSDVSRILLKFVHIV